MEITKREIIASISILAIMLIVGFVISGNITDYENDQKAMYNKALKIKEQDKFEYAMKTNTGNAFVEGELKAIDPVSFEAIDEEYLAMYRIMEEYVMKTRTVTYTDSKGKTQTRIETYWEWDTIGREEKRANKVNFLGVDFDSIKFSIPSTEYLDTISDGHNLRSKYYGYPKDSNITIFTSLKANTISDQSPVYRDTLDNTYESITSESIVPIFWLCWITLIFLAIYGFYYAENEWLN